LVVYLKSTLFLFIKKIIKNKFIIKNLDMVMHITNLFTYEEFTVQAKYLKTNKIIQDNLFIKTITSITYKINTYFNKYIHNYNNYLCLKSILLLNFFNIKFSFFFKKYLKFLFFIKNLKKNKNFKYLIKKFKNIYINIFKKYKKIILTIDIFFYYFTTLFIVIFNSTLKLHVMYKHINFLIVKKLYLLEYNIKYLQIHKLNAVLLVN